MTMTTARHGLPLLSPGQAQKEMFHNEAIAAIDALLHPHVEAAGTDAPTASPVEGRSWIVGRAPAGDWAGHADAIATWTAGGWRFQAPTDGMEVGVGAAGLRAAWRGGVWTVGVVTADRILIDGRQVVGARQPAISDPAAGSTIDAESRVAIGAVLRALRAHGLIA